MSFTATASRSLAYFRSPIEYDYTGANKRESNFRKKQAEIQPVKPVPEERDDISALDKAEELLMSEQMEAYKKQALSDMVMINSLAQGRWSYNIELVNLKLPVSVRFLIPGLIIGLKFWSINCIGF